MNRPLKAASLATVALTGFAANSILCRLVLGRNLVDPATFTMIRISSGSLASGVGYTLWYAALPMN